VDRGELSTDLALGVLTPASSVRSVEGHSPHQDAEGKARRRPRLKQDDPTDAETIDSESDNPNHQLDHMA